MTPLGYASDRLKVLEHERKSLLEEQAKKEGQFRCVEEERKVMIEIERKDYQKVEDLMAPQLENKFNNVHISGGNNSPPLTPPKSPRIGKH